MRTRQLVSVVTFVMGIGMAAGCGSSSSGSSGDGAAGSGGAGGTSGSGGTAGTGGTSGTGGTAGTGGTSGTGGSAGTGGTGGANMCVDQSLPPNGCLKSDIDTLTTCVLNACSTEIQACTGVCSDYYTCTNKCACTDTACRTACTKTSDCDMCSKKISECITGSFSPFGGGKCPIPSCLLPDGGLPNFGDGGFVIPDGGFTIPDGGFTIPDVSFTLPDVAAGGGCAALKSCCDATTDAAKKATCNAALAQLGGSDPACGGVLGGLKAQGYCM